MSSKDCQSWPAILIFKSLCVEGGKITYLDDSSSNYKFGAYTNFKWFSISISEYITKPRMTEGLGRAIGSTYRLDRKG